MVRKEPHTMTSQYKEDLHIIKKAALYFDLVLSEKPQPELESYVGGKPYIKNSNEIQLCEHCNQKMDFALQLYIPEKNSVNKKLYSIYYCFDCAYNGESGIFAVNIYTNPDRDSVLLDYEYDNIVPKCDIRFAPTYDIPEWDYLEEVFPQFSENLEAKYGDKAIDIYEDIDKKVKEYYYATGFKVKGYPEIIPFDDIPICPHTGKLMEPFLQMESIPELHLNWLGEFSYLILFKSPDHDEFEIRVIDLNEEFGDEEDEDDYDGENLI